MFVDGLGGNFVSSLLVIDINILRVNEPNSVECNFKQSNLYALYTFKVMANMSITLKHPVKVSYRKFTKRLFISKLSVDTVLIVALT